MDFSASLGGADRCATEQGPGTLGPEVRRVGYEPQNDAIQL
jgi:hypothetical protein